MESKNATHAGKNPYIATLARIIEVRAMGSAVFADHAPKLHHPRSKQICDFVALRFSIPSGVVRRTQHDYASLGAGMRQKPDFDGTEEAMKKTKARIKGPEDVYISL